MLVSEVIDILKSFANPTPENLKGMARYGINMERALCVSTPNIRKLAKQVGRDHALALQLWNAGWRETRILAALIDEPGNVTGEQMDSWVKDFDSWDVCDAACQHLFSWSNLSFEKAVAWSAREEEYVKRAGFALMACLAAGNRKSGDGPLAAFLPIIEREARDERNFVKKAVNWALRGVGKRSKHLNKLAIETAQRIKLQDSRSARWIASDALRELTSEKTLGRIKG
jgi:3-methyladenine DNA glycosylase AlkD